MTDLANVYQLFRNKFEECDFRYYAPPSYILTFTESHEKIIFAFKRVRWIVKDIKHYPDMDVSKDLNVTGSPLKDTSYVEDADLSKELIDLRPEQCWTPEEDNYGPLSTEEARSILQNFINLDCRIGRGNIWVLCCGTDTDQTVLLQLTANCASQEQRKFIRGVVRCTGVQPSSSLSMAQLISIHRQRAGTGMKFNPKITVQQWYSLSPYVNIRLSWHTMGENASFAIERNARVRLSQRFPINNGAFSRLSVAEYFWQQLQRLALFREKILDIRANRVSGYASNDLSNSGMMEVDLEYVKQKVNNILSTFSAEEPTSFNQASIANMVQQVQQRNLTDVMERLYETLTLCSSYEDLKASIDYIFHLSTHSNIVNVPTDGTRFARLILAMIQDRLAIPSLTGPEPYELLLECGFSKLMNDYRTIFSECGIYELEFEKLFQPQVTNTRKSRYAAGTVTTVEPLKGKVSSMLFQPTVDERTREKSILLSNFDEEEVKLKLDRLAQVHLLLEHLLLLESVVNVPSMYGRVCELYMNREACGYNDVYNRDSDLLEFDVEEFKLLAQAEKLTPHAQRVSMGSANLLQKLDTVFYQNAQPILPKQFYPQFQNDDTDLGEIFWCYEYDKIERL
ncbi:protein zwilch [Anopheles nili]|uniref:protein zwilch n=1 Tax=Anopheles nili TaxID=185578 RepID=UPI00237ADE0E|nr:protein zwilch [Anopheles nili]